MKNGYIYQGYGRDIRKIDITEILEKNSVMEDVVKEIAKKYIKINVEYGLSMCASWNGELYRYIWVKEEEYNDDIIHNHIGIYSRVTNCLEPGKKKKQLIYWPGKVVLVKHDIDKYHFDSIDDNGAELFGMDINDSNKIKKELWNID